MYTSLITHNEYRIYKIGMCTYNTACMHMGVYVRSSLCINMVYCCLLDSDFCEMCRRCPGIAIVLLHVHSLYPKRERQEKEEREREGVRKEKGEREGVVREGEERGEASKRREGGIMRGEQRE